MSHALPTALSLALLSALAGCARSAPPVASAPSAAPEGSPCTLPIRVKLEGSERLNPDAAGAALPTVVRVYELKEVGRVEESDFTAIWETPEQALGADLVGVRELTLFPGQATALDLPLKPEARFLVGVAIFRRPTGTQWRSILPMPDSARLCAAYKAQGAPDPAVSFLFDQYRVEGRSRLLAGHTEHALPGDVAPDPTTNPEKEP